MDQKIGNPLAKHFRQPAIYLKLPSGGKFWPQKTLNLPPNGEIPIFPMTAQDEILLKTPDALMNGEGMLSVIQSCCPNIIDARQMPSVDIDAVLLAIRIASYGNQMEFDVVCPSCQEELSYNIDVQEILSRIRMPTFQPFYLKGLTFNFKPQPYSSVNDIALRNFEESRIVQTLNNENISIEEKKRIIDAQVKRLTNISVNSLANSTESITTADGTVVTNLDQITEFYHNCESKILKDVQGQLNKLFDSISIKSQQANCSKCQVLLEVPLEFNNSNFFV